jgi:hypothetical protein
MYGPQSDDARTTHYYPLLIILSYYQLLYITDRKTKID